MSKNFRSLTVAGLLALGVTAGPAQAAFVNGTFTPSDGLLNSFAGSTTSIVSTLLSFDLGPVFANGGCTAGSTFALLGCPGAGTTSNQPIVYGTGGIFLHYEIFDFDVTSFGPIGTTAFSCGGGFCSDQRTFTMSGTIPAVGGFSTTPFLWSFTATGTCTDDGTGKCVLGTAGGSWAGSVSAAGHAVTVPEPGTLALLGLAVGMFGLVNRRRSA